MKNKIIVLGILLCYGMSLAACQVPQSIQNSGKKIKTTKYYKVNPQTGEKVLTYISYFNEEGNETKRVNYDKGVVKNEVIYEYDEQDRILKITDLEDGKTNLRIAYEYKGNLKIKEKTPYETVDYEYDDKGNITTEKVYESDGSMDQFLFYEYAYEGERLLAKLTLEQREKEGKKQKLRLSKYAYNAQGQLTKEHLVALYDERLFTHTYHSNGKLKETIEVAFENKEKIIHHFNTEGKKTKVEVYRRKVVEDEFELDRTNFWIHNEFGDLIERKSKREDTIISRNVIEISYY